MKNQRKVYLLIALVFLAFSNAACFNTGKKVDTDSDLDLLSGVTFKGSKYFLGFGRAMPNDPALLQNETQYDVQHTNDIFSSSLGGNYQSTILQKQQANETQIRQAWQSIKSKMTDQDMYIQYSSSHGFEQGLEVGLSYNEMASYALSLPAKEVIVFTMACYSGGLVDALNRRKSEWENYSKNGRTFLVMASSPSNQTSITGPGVDRGGDESSRANGSAGSAFGNSLWKSMLGDADGVTDGVKDGLLSIGEIIRGTIMATSQESGGHHTPVFTGSFDPHTVVNIQKRASVKATSLSADEYATIDQIMLQRSKELIASGKTFIDQVWEKSPVPGSYANYAARFKMGALKVDLANEWQLKQEFKTSDKSVVTIKKDNLVVTIYTSKGSVDLKTTFAYRANITKDLFTDQRNGLSIQRLEATKNPPPGSQSAPWNTQSFLISLNGASYYGYISSNEVQHDALRAAMDQVLNGFSLNN